MQNNVIYPFKTRNDFLKDVVEELVRLRKQRKYTQEELNYRLGVADRLISKWECGLRTPTSFNLYCWADALDARLKIVANDNWQNTTQCPANDNVQHKLTKKIG
jgi:transcriptional regulator with XRE-family HTH domain